MRLSIGISARPLKTVAVYYLDNKHFRLPRCNPSYLARIEPNPVQLDSAGFPSGLSKMTRSRTHLIVTPMQQTRTQAQQSIDFTSVQSLPKTRCDLFRRLTVVPMQEARSVLPLILSAGPKTTAEIRRKSLLD